MNHEFCVYASGYIGANLHTNGILVNSRAVQSAPGVTIDVKESSTHLFSTRIVDNYVTMLRSPQATITFDFREKVIKDVLDAFGMPYLDGWFASNYATGYMDPLRQKFLDECVNFVCGRGRGMPVNIYLSSIGLPGEKANTPRLSSTLADFIGVSSVDNALRQNTIKTSEVIQSWIAQPGGFNDLISSAMIFWGDHSIR